MASRLIDKLIENKETPQRIKDELLTATVINADNIAEYVFQQMTQMDKTFVEWFSHLPVVAPSLRKAFIQCKFQRNGKQFELGAFYQTARPDDDNFRWGMECVVFGAFPMSPTIGSVGCDIDHEGRIWHDNIKGNFDLRLTDEWRTVFESQPFDGQERIRMHLVYTFTVVLWTLAFMNTKNVIMEAVEPSASENKRRAKHGKLPLMRYHVLKIKPIGREFGHDQGGTHTSLALHIRRGHFKTYTDAAPLFGKLVGTFWVDQHIAGKKSDRVVIKDYEVLTQ